MRKREEVEEAREFPSPDEPDPESSSGLFRRHVEKKISNFKHITPTQYKERFQEPETPAVGDISHVYAVEQVSKELVPEIRIEPDITPKRGENKDQEGTKGQKGIKLNFGKIRDDVKRSFSRISALVPPPKWKKGGGSQNTEASSINMGDAASEMETKGNQSPHEGLPHRPSQVDPSANKWKSLDLAEKYRKTDSDAYISLTIRDFFLYFIFLTSVTIVAIGSLSYIMYVYSFILSDVLTKRQFTMETSKYPTNFRDLKTIEQLWNFIIQVFLDVVYLQTMRERGGRIVLTADEEALYIFQNIVLGVPRIRQVRVRPDSCKIPRDFHTVFNTCYDYYSPDAEDENPFGAKSGSEWTYSDKLAEEYVGKVSKYGQGGYYLNFTRNYEVTRNKLEELNKTRWIDYGTRAVFLDFTVYSPNVNLFCVVKLVAELPPSGGVITSSNLKTLKLIRYVTTWDYILFAFEVVCIIFIILYTTEEIRSVILLKWLYLCRFWNVVSIIIVILGWNCISLAAWRYYVVFTALPDLINTIKSDDHGNFDNISYIQELFDVFLAFFVAFVWFKLLKFLMMIKVIYHLLATLGKVLFELLGLLFILAIIMLSFALIGHLLFGSQVEEFSTIGKSIVSLFLLIIGALEYKKIQEIRPILGALFFMMFIFFFILIFLSLIIAVIVNGFTILRFEIMEDRSRIYLKSMLYKFGISILNCVRMKEFSNKLKRKQENDKLKEEYEVLLEILRRSGFRGKELELFLKKYNVEEGTPITEKKMQEIYDDIDTKEQLYVEAVEHEQIMSQVDILKMRMNYVDRMTEEMSAKVELLLEKVIRK